MAGFNHFIINGLSPGRKTGIKIAGTRPMNITNSSHLLESKKGRFVRTPRNPITKKKAAKIPNQIGTIIENIVM